MPKKKKAKKRKRKKPQWQQKLIKDKLRSNLKKYQNKNKLKWGTADQQIGEMKHAPKQVLGCSDITGCSGSNSSGASGTTALPAASLHWKKKPLYGTHSLRSGSWGYCKTIIYKTRFTLCFVAEESRNKLIVPLLQWFKRRALFQGQIKARLIISFLHIL